MSSISRKSFIAGAGTGIAGVAALGLAASGAGSALAAEASGSSDGDQYDYEADVVIIGAGGAGQSAAAAAHEAGSSTILIEKASFTGGDSITSHNDILAFWPSHSGENEDDAESYLEDWKATHWVSVMGQRGEDFPDPDFPFARRFMELWAPVGQWLEDNAGVQWTGVSLGRALATEYTPLYRTWHAENEPIMTSLYRVISGWDDSQTLLDTEAFEFIQNPDGVVCGVRCYEHNTGAVITVHANKGVVLSTGTFCAARDMIGTYYGRDVAQLSTTGFMNLTGDGHKMARNIGAGFRGLDLGLNWQPCGTGTKRNWDTIEGRLYLFGYYDGALAPADPAIAVNLEGKRYLNEDMVNYAIGKATYQQTNQTGFYVFDSRFDAHVVYDGEEVMTKDDTIYYQADTLEELAMRMNCDEQGFLDEIERYNGFVDSGEDLDWGRDMTVVSKIEQPPFFAFPITPQYYVTFGGVKTDIDSRVLTDDDRVIPGLYAAGVVTGTYAEQEGLVYYGGFDQALAWGWQAGENAAAFDPEGQVMEAGEPAPISYAVPSSAAGSAAGDVTYADGTYEGVGTGRNGDVPVTVTIEGGVITSVEVGENSETEGIGSNAIEQLPDEIVAANGIDGVDAVAGATLTSQGIFEAVSQALESAQA
jgi:fumarate reductase flavoprotein subunit